MQYQKCKYTSKGQQVSLSHMIGAYLEGKVETDAGRDEQHTEKDGIVGQGEVVRVTGSHDYCWSGTLGTLKHLLQKLVVFL